MRVRRNKEDKKMEKYFFNCRNCSARKLMYDGMDESHKQPTLILSFFFLFLYFFCTLSNQNKQKEGKNTQFLIRSARKAIYICAAMNELHVCSLTHSFTQSLCLTLTESHSLYFHFTLFCVVSLTLCLSLTWCVFSYSTCHIIWGCIEVYCIHTQQSHTYRSFVFAQLKIANWSAFKCGVVNSQHLSIVWHATCKFSACSNDSFFMFIKHSSHSLYFAIFEL